MYFFQDKNNITISLLPPKSRAIDEPVLIMGQSDGTGGFWYVIPKSGGMEYI